VDFGRSHVLGPRADIRSSCTQLERASAGQSASALPLLSPPNQQQPRASPRIASLPFHTINGTNQQTQETGAEPRPGQAKQRAKSHSLQVPDRDVDVSSLHPAKGQRVGKILAYTSETPVASLVRPVFVTNCQPRDPPLAIVLKLTVSDVNLLSGVLRNQHCAVACANGFSRCHISDK